MQVYLLLDYREEAAPGKERELFIKDLALSKEQAEEWAKDNSHWVIGPIDEVLPK